jgi:ubiquitin carboxyl-terminal hydrolase 25
MIMLTIEQEPGPGSATHPVGLENVAQTCYMNSLFQYYFSVKPLRNAILNYEEHEEEDLTEEELKKKQISEWELDRSKRCTVLSTFRLILVIAQLRLLFQELITSDLAYIRPKEELVRLTLVDVKQEVEDEAIRRRQSLLTNASQSILDADIPDLVEIEDTSVPRAPVSSPTIIPTTGENVPEIESPIQITTAEATNDVAPPHEDVEYEFIDHESNESGGVVSLTTSDPMSVDKENTPQSRVVSNAPAEKSPLQESQLANVKTEEVKGGEDVEMTDAPPTPPKTPPPVPRRPVQKRKSTWGVMKYGSQQDVTECITNCLSQLHAGFKPDEFDERGDPIDLFKR